MIQRTVSVFFEMDLGVLVMFCLWFALGITIFCAQMMVFICVISRSTLLVPWECYTVAVGRKIASILGDVAIMQIRQYEKPK